MVLVAVAGGTSPTLGKSVVTAILEARKHDVVILGRNTPEAPTSKYGATVRSVDYNSVQSLSKALEGVHTLISVAKLRGEEPMLSFNRSLLQASKEAGVKRFAPSEFDIGPLAQAKVDFLRPKLQIWKLCESSGLQCAKFSLGMFMTYLGPDGSSANHSNALAGLLDNKLMLDYINIDKGYALVPVNDKGKPARISMCNIADVGKFIAAALDLDKWEAELGFVGSTATMEEIAEAARRAGRPMKTEPITKAQVQERQKICQRQLDKKFTVQAALGKGVAQLVEAMCDDEIGSAVIEPVLNKMFPGIKPMTHEEYIKKYWSVASV